MTIISMPTSTSMDDGLTQREVPGDGGDTSEGFNSMLVQCDGEIAVNAIRHLVASGKVSADDAKLAIEHCRAATNETSLAAEKDALPSNTIMAAKANNKRVVEKSTIQEKYRTRHVALQFFYDGTDFTGFAQNVGKEYDNSIEKALFAALEKTRLLVSPDEQGMLVMNKDEELVVVDKGGVAATTDLNMSARTASKYSRCGRTDKGVHAHGQVVAIYLKSAFPLLAQRAKDVLDDDDDDNALDTLLEEDSLPKNSLDGVKCLVPSKQNSKGGNSDAKQSSLQQKFITEYDYPRILNNVLPPAIRVLGWCPVSSEFSARFSCSSRTYRYFFPRRNLDLCAMARGLQYMMGRRDFRNLCKMNCEQVYNFERILVKGKVVSPQQKYIASMEENNATIQDGVSDAHASPRDMCHVEIIGQAFLWHQIRCIMSILFYIGRHLESPEIVKQLLDIETHPAKPSYDMASETALVLQHCQFNNLSVGRTVRNLWDVTRVLERRWENHAVAAERARDALESMKEETEVRWTDVVEFVEQIADSRRRKERKSIKKTITIDDDSEIRRELERRCPGTTMISWASAMNIIQNLLGVYPHPSNGSSQDQKGQTESTVHVPIMERAKGTTYEEKVQSILGEGNGMNGKRSKRKDRYEENVIKKRKTTEEDQAFYTRMLQQGGSSG
ncbi:hypothetical protein ACHAXH_005770 [Discostella pseudostelligera]